MTQILCDPAEFGKAVLERKKSDHCIHNVFDLRDRQIKSECQRPSRQEQKVDIIQLYYIIFCIFF